MFTHSSPFTPSLSLRSISAISALIAILLVAAFSSTATAAQPVCQDKAVTGVSKKWKGAAVEVDAKWCVTGSKVGTVTINRVGFYGPSGPTVWIAKYPASYIRPAKSSNSSKRSFDVYGLLTSGSKKHSMSWSFTVTKSGAKLTEK